MPIHESMEGNLHSNLIYNSVENLSQWWENPFIFQDIAQDSDNVPELSIRLADDPELCQKLIEAGVSTIYLQFDGVTSEPYIITRGLDLLEKK